MRLLIGIILCVGLIAATAGAQMRPDDARRVLPNNNAPPERRVPHTVLPPLPNSEAVVIRRVGGVPGKVVALTFDLCELATVTTGYDAPLIDFLRERQIPATLFLGGKWMRTHRDRTLELMADPLFEIGNHAWSHGNFGVMSEAAMREQVEWTQAQYELLRETLTQTGRGEHTPPCPTLFRLPYGRCSEAALRLLADYGLRVIQWDVEGDGNTDNTVPGMAHELVRRVRPGSILLFHANLVPRGSAVLMQRTVKALQEKGYTFVTVSRLLESGTPVGTHDGYFSVPGDNLKLDHMFGHDGTGKRVDYKQSH